MMNLICIIIVFLIICVLLNEFFFWKVLGNTQEIQILKGKKGTYKAISFGSAYCRYGIDFGDNYNGFNFGFASQFFYYTDKMLRDIAPKCLEKKGIVFLIIADLVFAEYGKGLYGADRYQILLSKEILGDEYKLGLWIKKRFPLFFYPLCLRQILSYIIKGSRNNYTSIKFNNLTNGQVLEAAKKRCKDWCEQFGLKDTISPEVSEELEQKFIQTREILTRMIQFCYDNDYRPVLVITPVSEIMNSQIGDKFIQKVLYENIALANKQNAPLLDYLRDERFKDESLYHNNADFLNSRGRKLFTDILMKDVCKLV